MSRRIIAEQLQAGGTGSDVDGYKDRLLKYIPADVVGAWIAVTRLLSGVVGVPTAEILCGSSPSEDHSPRSRATIRSMVRWY